MGNDQKPRRSSCIVFEPHNFKILPHGYDTPQLKNIAIPAIASSLHNLKILPTCQLDFWGVSNPTKFFLEIGRNYVSIMIFIISVTNVTIITVLCHTMLFALDILCL